MGRNKRKASKVTVCETETREAITENPLALAMGSLSIICMFLSSCGFIKGSTFAPLDSAFKTVDKIIPQDSVPEEMIEEIIKRYTSLDLDLTPGSPENN